MGTCYIEARSGFFGIGRKREKLEDDNFRIARSAIGIRLGSVYAYGHSIRSGHEDLMRIYPDIGSDVISEFKLPAVWQGSQKRVDLRPGQEAVLVRGKEKVRLIHKK